ncbi:hypothetical protein ACFV85_14830 [Streptomyces niveus]|uniref:hypothetical protein n=1 Tax=Streptomyces niveus TaxID=193462 RepID=UPI00365F3659
MRIVYTNRRDGEKCVHLEIEAHEVAALVDGDPDHTARVGALLAEADRRLNPGRAAGEGAEE